MSMSLVGCVGCPYKMKAGQVNVASFSARARFFETAEKDDYDTFVKSFDNPSARSMVESGKSILCKLKPQETLL